MFRPRRKPTATRMASSDRRRPHAVIDSAYSQSLLCGALEANSLALSISELAPSQIAFTSSITLGSYHDIDDEHLYRLGKGERLMSPRCPEPTLPRCPLRRCRRRVYGPVSLACSRLKPRRRNVPARIRIVYLDNRRGLAARRSHTHSVEAWEVFGLGRHHA